MGTSGKRRVRQADSPGCPWLRRRRRARKSCVCPLGGGTGRGCPSLPAETASNYKKTPAGKTDEHLLACALFGQLDLHPLKHPALFGRPYPLWGKKEPPGRLAANKTKLVKHGGLNPPCCFSLPSSGLAPFGHLKREVCSLQRESESLKMFAGL